MSKPSSSFAAVIYARCLSSIISQFINRFLLAFLFLFQNEDHIKLKIQMLDRRHVSASDFWGRVNVKRTLLVVLLSENQLMFKILRASTA